ncbi:MAG TPA: zinc-binding dehydrogenase [Terriglobales bacterium]|nr:zinc-binding dehydrogenase [Terriglobales bacterium]
MKAARIHQFGPPEVVVIDDLSRPNPDKGDLLVRVKAAHRTAHSLERTRSSRSLPPEWWPESHDTPYTSSPARKSLSPGLIVSTTPEISEPNVSGGRGLTLLLPSRMSASHGPTPFFYADVTTARLNILTKLFEEEKLSARVGSILPLQDARTAHYMLAGAPHKPGKIVLEMAA